MPTETWERHNFSQIKICEREKALLICQWHFQFSMAESRTTKVGFLHNYCVFALILLLTKNFVSKHPWNIMRNIHVTSSWNICDARGLRCIMNCQKMSESAFFVHKPLCWGIRELKDWITEKVLSIFPLLKYSAHLFHLKEPQNPSCVIVLICLYFLHLNHIDYVKWELTM